MNLSEPAQQSPFSFKPFLWTLALLALVGIGIAVFQLAPNPRQSLSETEKQLHTVRRGDFVIKVVEKGTLESSANTEIKCQVRGGYGGRGGQSTVTYVIKPGTIVKKDDVLVRLDTKVIEETISLGITDTNNAKAELVRAKADLSSAAVAGNAYVNGRYKSQKNSWLGQLEIAREHLITAKQVFADTQLLKSRGFVNQFELDGAEFRVKQAELDVSIRETQIDVLDRLTKPMEVESLEQRLIASQARVKGREAGVELEQGRLDLARQEEKNCTIRAPKDGLVIYPSTAQWKNSPDIEIGSSVRNDQLLLLMPNLDQMQVKVGIHESYIDRIKTGFAAKIKLPSKTIDAEIASISPVARPAGWWSGNVVKYNSVIKLKKSPGVYPGLTANVEIVIEEHRDVITVPNEAVIEADNVHYCWVESSSGTTRRTVQIGDSNDQSVVITDGIQENENVVLNPLEHFADARELVKSKMVHTVEKGDMQIVITEQGSLESSNNTQLKCLVRGRSTINWVVESGTEVQKGDVILRLDNKEIEDYLHERKKFAYLSEDSAIGFRVDALRAKLAINEYLEGQFVTGLMEKERELAVANETLRTAQNRLAHVKNVYSRGFATDLEMEEAKFAVEDAIKAVDLKNTDIASYKNFTKKEQVETLQGDWESAAASLKGHEEVLKMDEKRMQLAQDELKRCVVTAPRDGLVIYPPTEEWKRTPDIVEGATVHQSQVLLLMPDLKKMRVKLGVHERLVDSVKVGMSALVKIHDQTIIGSVASVASVTKPAGWWTGNVVKYDVLIDLPLTDGDLKPGMSAEVQIIVNNHREAVKIPLTAIVQNDEGFFCWVGDTQNAEKRSIVLGDNTDDFYQVLSGIEPGENVVIQPSQFFTEARSESQPNG